MNRKTKKMRLIDGAAAKNKVLCLNDSIDQGPNLQQDMIKVLIRFRRRQVAIICDISEMYMQVEIAEADR